MILSHPTTPSDHVCDKTCGDPRKQTAEHIAAVIAHHVTSPYRLGDSRELLSRVPLRHRAEVRRLLAQPLGQPLAQPLTRAA